MEMQGEVEVFEWHDRETGLKVWIAEYDPELDSRLHVLHAAAQTDPAARRKLDGFSHKVLEGMALGVAPHVQEEAPLYYWVRAMKVLNRLSFEDGEYFIPDTLAASIVRCPGAKNFIRMLG